MLLLQLPHRWQLYTRVNRLAITPGITRSLGRSCKAQIDITPSKHSFDLPLSCHESVLSGTTL